jgi:hypothetical protein
MKFIKMLAIKTYAHLIVIFFTIINAAPALAQAYPACDPNIHPDRWDNCIINNRQIGFYLGPPHGPPNLDISQRVYPKEVSARVDRASKIWKPMEDFNPIIGSTNLLFRRGVFIGTYWAPPPHNNCWTMEEAIARKTTWFKDIEKNEKDGCLFDIRFNAAEQARLQGDYAKANAIEAAEAAREKKSRDQTVEDRINIRRKFCVNKPNVTLSAIEDFSNRLAVNPNQISLARMTFKVETTDCKAVFHHPKGTSVCGVEFGPQGNITQITNCK